MALPTRSAAVHDGARDTDAIAVRGSLTPNPTTLARLVEQATDTYGPVDAVVDHAGSSGTGPLLQIDDDDWWARFDLLLSVV